MQTGAMPGIAGASSSDAAVCRRAAARSAMGLAQHQPLRTPQTIFPLPGQVMAELLQLRQILGKLIPDSRAPQATQRPGARASPFSQGWGWALPAASPQIQASAAAPGRVPDWPRLSRNSRSLPITPSANKKRAGSTWWRPSPAQTCWCREEAPRHPVSLLSLLQLQRRESPEPRLPRRCRPHPHSSSLLSNPSFWPPFEGAHLSPQLQGGQRVKALRGRDGNTGIRRDEIWLLWEGQK